MPRWSLLLAVCAFSLAEAQFGWMYAAEDVLEKELQAPDKLLEKLETGTAKLVSWTKSQQRLLTAAGGATLLFCSKELTFALLFLQSFRSVGWPLVQSGVAELRVSYAAARKKFKEELPTILKSKQVLPKLLKQKKEAEELLSAAAALTKTLQADAKVAEQELRRAAKAVEDALPSRRELEAVAATATKGLPSKKQVAAELRRAQRLKSSVDKKLASFDAKSSAGDVKALLASLEADKREAEAAVASAQAMAQTFEAAMRAALEQAKKALPNAAELKEAKDAAEWGRKTVEKRLAEGLQLKDSAVAKYAEVMETVGSAMAVSNSVQAVGSALEPDKLARIGNGVAAGVMSCVASATSPVAGSALIGADLGSIIAFKAVPLAVAGKKFLVERVANRHLPAGLAKHANSSKWVEAGARAASTGLGVFAAYKGRQLALLTSGALLGAKMVVGAVADQAEAWLAKHKDLEDALASAAGRAQDALASTLDKIEGADRIAVGRAIPKLDRRAVAELALAGAGIALQLGLISVGPLAGLLSPLRAAIAPLLAFEAYLKVTAAAA